MKKHLMVLSLITLTVGCSNNADNSGSDLVVGADTGTQSDLVGNWTQACQAGEFTGSGFAAFNGANDDSAGAALFNVGTQGGGDDQQGGGDDQQGGGDDQQGGGDDQQGGGDDQQGGGDDQQGDGTVAAIQNTLMITDSQMTLVTRGYADASCAGEPLLEAEVEMDYEIPNYTAGANNEVNMTLNSSRVTMESDEAADAANEAKLCGFSNWQADQSKNIAGTDCLKNMPDSTGDEFFQTLNYQNGNLLFGMMTEEQDGTSAEDRPTSLGSVPFTKDPGSDDGSDDNGDGTGDGADDGTGDEGDGTGDGADDGSDDGTGDAA